MDERDDEVGFPFCNSLILYHSESFHWSNIGVRLHECCRAAGRCTSCKCMYEKLLQTSISAQLPTSINLTPHSSYGRMQSPVEHSDQLQLYVLPRMVTIYVKPGSGSNGLHGTQWHLQKQIRVKTTGPIANEETMTTRQIQIILNDRIHPSIWTDP